MGGQLVKDGTCPGWKDVLRSLVLFVTALQTDRTHHIPRVMQMSTGNPPLQLTENVHQSTGWPNKNPPISLRQFKPIRNTAKHS